MRLSAFQDANQLLLETGHLGEPSSVTSSQPERPGSSASLGGSSSLDSKPRLLISDTATADAYETSNGRTSIQQILYSPESGSESGQSIHELSASAGEISNGVLVGESFLGQPEESLKMNLQPRKEILASRRESLYGNPSKVVPIPRERIEFNPEQDHYKLSGHSRKLSSDSIGSDVSSLRGSEVSITGGSNSIWDGSADLNVVESQSLNDAQIILSLDQRHKLNRVLVSMQRRLVTAKTDMEDLIARLNQEMTVKEYLTTKVCTLFA